MDQRALIRVIRAVGLAVAVATLIVGVGIVVNPTEKPQATTSPTPTPTPEDDCVKIIAHRGASGQAPENTMKAIRLAVRQGADLVEVDVHRSLDGHLVVIHDDTLERTTNAEHVFPHRSPWRVRDFTLRDIRKLDADGQQVPTLAEALTYIDGTDADLVVEAKHPDLYSGLDRDIATAVDGHHAEVVSFSRDFLKRMHRLGVDAPLGWIIRDLPTNLRSLMWLDYFQNRHDLVNPKWIEQANAVGINVRVGGVNNAYDMEHAIDAGVEGVTTDHPARIADVRGCK